MDRATPTSWAAAVAVVPSPVCRSPTTRAWTSAPTSRGRFSSPTSTSPTPRPLSAVPRHRRRRFRSLTSRTPRSHRSICPPSATTRPASRCRVPTAVSPPSRPPAMPRKFSSVCMRKSEPRPRSTTSAPRSPQPSRPATTPRSCTPSTSNWRRPCGIRTRPPRTSPMRRQNRLTTGTRSPLRAAASLPRTPRWDPNSAPA